VDDLELLREQVREHQRVLEQHDGLIKELVKGHQKMRNDQEDVNRKIDLMEKN
jgi:hypothetical protein